jgi:alpha-L-fucosidase
MIFKALFSVSFLAFLVNAEVRYEANWDSVDKRPIPTWFDEAKIGIFIHWGVYSVPAYGSEWFLKYFHDGNVKYRDYVHKNYGENFTYEQFAPLFTAKHYDPNKWADLFHASGAKYVVLTSKHHEGYCLWPTKYSPKWNVMDVGPHRDLLGIKNHN